MASETTNCRQSQGYNCTHVHTYIHTYIHTERHQSRSQADLWEGEKRFSPPTNRPGNEASMDMYTSLSV